MNRAELGAHHKCSGSFCLLFVPSSNGGVFFFDIVPQTPFNESPYEQGYSMMVGGSPEAVKSIAPILNTLAPPKGWHHFGETGSGHYVKMVHNAIEYGIMESYAEGYRMLREGPIAGIDLAAAGNVWQNGSIISSLINKLAAEALSENPDLFGIEGYVHESGETRWALETANEIGMRLPAIQAAFDIRIKSQQGEKNFATKLLAAIRNKFGGHSINKEAK